MTDYRYTLTVTLLEDLHSGAGAGTPIIDRLQARDEHDWPVINRTHLKGVLRDNAERLHRLGQLDPGFSEQVFGAAGHRQGLLQCHALRLQQPETTLTWDATARQLNSRVPEDDSLRRTEYVPAGAVFRGHLTLHDDDEDLACGLEKVLRFTDRLGSERTRGSGLIKLQFTLEKMAKWLASARWSSPPAPQDAVLRLLLRNEEPLCLPHTGLPGNLIDSETYIPGRVLFGALCCWALQSRPDDSRAHLLFDRQFSIGNAYPLPRGLKANPADRLAELAVYPIPLNLYAAKASNRQSQVDNAATPSLTWPHWCDSKPQARNLAMLRAHQEISDPLSPVPDEHPAPTALKRPKAHSYLCALQPRHWWLYETELALQMRNRRGPPIGEVKRTDTALFTVEQIPAGTWFVADIVIGPQAPIGEFLELYDALLQQRATLSIGRGGAPLSVVAWQFGPGLNLSAAATEAPLDTLQITLTSDLIARDQRLNFHQQLNISALRDLLGETAGDWAAIHPMGAKSDYDIVRAFNASSGLPRAPVCAIRRGSVLRLEGAGITDLRQQLATRPMLGERGWEGHGRFLLDHYPLAEAVMEQDADAGDFEPINRSSPAIGRQEAVIRQAEAYMAQLSGKQPSRSQFGQLLDAVRALGAEATTKQLQEALETFVAASSKKSGEGWKTLFDASKPSQDLRQQLPRTASAAQLFIEVMISLSEAANDQ